MVAKSTRLGSDIQSIQYRYQHHLSRMFNKTKSNYLNSKSLYIQAYTPLSTFAIHFELSNFKFPGKKTIIINRNNSLKTPLIIITHYIRTCTRDSFSCHRSVRLIVNSNKILAESRRTLPLTPLPINQHINIRKYSKEC